MARDKSILICTECLSRNYNITKKQSDAKERFVIKKFCPRCNKHTIHKESK